MKWLFATVLAGILLFPLAGTAQHTPSPRYGAFELKFGPFKPNSDAIPTAEDAYSYDEIFGSKGNMLLSTIELDWQFARIPNVLSVALGGSIGIMNAEARARVYDSANEEYINSSDKTRLWVMPFGILGVLRIDVLADLLSIPFVPYFKTGPAWYVWWTKTAGRKEGSGGTPGWHSMLGLALRLDWIEKTVARTFDNEMGVNHSYLFFEILFAQIDGFGDRGKLPLSPTNIRGKATWMAGLCLEF